MLKASCKEDLAPIGAGRRRPQGPRAYGGQAAQSGFYHKLPASACGHSITEKYAPESF